MNTHGITVTDNSNEFVAEASTLGWKPGEFKDHIDFNGESFHYVNADVTEGSYVAWHYVSRSGRTITVFND